MSEGEAEAPQLALPDGWSLRRVRDITSVVSTSGCKVKLRDYLTKGALAVVDQGQLLVGGFTDDTTKQVGTALPVIVFGDHTRRLKYVDFPFAAGADGTKVLNPGVEVLPRLLYRLLQAVDLPDRGYGRHYQFLADSEIPVPPLPEQRRLVEKIERLLEQSRTAREALDRIPPLLKRFRQAVLAKAFRGELTERDPNDEPASVLLERIREERRHKWEGDLRARGKDPRKAKYVEPEPPDTSGLPELPEGWVWATLDSIAEVRSGVAKGRHLSGTDIIEVPYLRVANVQSGYLDLREVKRIQIRRSELDRYRLIPGDVLFTEGGDRDKLGRGTVWRGQVMPCVHQNHIHCARPRTSDVSSDFVSLSTQLPSARDYFWSVASQTVNLASMNASNLRAYVIALPPAAEQRRIVAKVEALFAQADSIGQGLDKARWRAEHVDGAVLARAFRGEL